MSLKRTVDDWRAFVAYDPETGFFTSCPNGRRIGGKQSKGYVEIKAKGERVRAHRLAWAFVHGDWPSEEIDHKDGNRANNAIPNLRWATRSQNSANSADRRPNKTSGFRGVSWQKDKKMWRAQVTYRRTQIHLGRFASKEEAARAYDRAAIKLFGEFARPNFRQAA